MAKCEEHGRRTVWFSGQVQGVGFRFRTLRVAERFCVAGFVRNLSDGRVELVAEGAPLELDRFVAAVRAEMQDYIDSAVAHSSPGTHEFSRFEISS